MCDRVDTNSVNKFLEVRSKLNELLAQEETYWHQRAKIYWLKDGDRNTRYFHSCAQARQKKNRISQLIDENGSSITVQQELCDHIQLHFQNIYSPANITDSVDLNVLDVVVTEEMNRNLARPFIEVEFKEALFQMFPDKSLIGVKNPYLWVRF